MSFQKIPQKLKTRPQWVLWKSETRDGKPTKIPYCPQDPRRKAEADNPTTWGAFEKAEAISKNNGFAGIGYEFSADDPFTGIDLDHCRAPETGEIETWARAIINRLASYTEISPSGCGVHILVAGKLPPGRRRKGKVEMYDSGRYFTMTGHHLEGTPATIENRQTELEALHTEIFGKPKGEPQAAPPKSTGGVPDGSNGLSDDDLIDRIRKSKGGAKFDHFMNFANLEDLLFRYTLTSQSEADLSFCSTLAWWTRKNAAQMDRIFRRSRLMRKKWDEYRGGQTYGEWTITKAIAGCTEVWKSVGKRRKSKTAQARPPEPGGGTPEQLRALLDVASEWDPTTAPPDEPQKADAVSSECGYGYAVSGDRHCLVVNFEGGVELKPLCSFTAQIINEIVRNDGLRITKEFTIAGSVAGLQLPQAKVPTKDFDGMKWIREHWGAMASVSPNRTNAGHLPNAILAHSRAQGINRQTIYAHTGWCQINGVYRYLHGGGAIGPGEPVAVDLGENLFPYRLPEPGGPEEALANLRFLEIGPWEIMAPLWASVYLAPFSDLLKIDFSLWLHGPTGSLKSTLAALALAHFGNFTRLTLPGSWFSTVNSLEKLTFILKDSICVIDDFCPPANQKESHAMAERAGRIIYQAGNRSARERLGPDLMARPNYHPRCMIISTGEMLLPGQRQSATARYLGLELDPKKVQIDKARLTEAQREAHLYPAAMAAYLEGMASQLEDTLDEVRDLWTGYRTAFQNSSNHMRIPEILAWLTIGFELGLRFQVSMGNITQNQSYEMLKRAWKVFGSLGAKHSQTILGDRPTLKFLNVLRELFIQGRIYVESSTATGPPSQNQRLLGWHGSEPEKNAELVGWADESTLYLLPETTVRIVKESVRRQGDYLSLGRNELLAALSREEFILPGKDGKNTQVRWLQGGSKRVICLPLEKLAHDEAVEDAS